MCHARQNNTVWRAVSTVHGCDEIKHRIWIWRRGGGGASTKTESEQGTTHSRIGGKNRALFIWRVPPKEALLGLNGYCQPIGNVDWRFEAHLWEAGQQTLPWAQTDEGHGRVVGGRVARDRVEQEEC